MPPTPPLPPTSFEARAVAGTAGALTQGGAVKTLPLPLPGSSLHRTVVTLLPPTALSLPLPRPSSNVPGQKKRADVDQGPPPQLPVISQQFPQIPVPVPPSPSPPVFSSQACIPTLQKLVDCTAANFDTTSLFFGFCVRTSYCDFFHHCRQLCQS